MNKVVGRKGSINPDSEQLISSLSVHSEEHVAISAKRKKSEPHWIEQYKGKNLFITTV